MKKLRALIAENFLPRLMARFMKPFRNIRLFLNLRSWLLLYGAASYTNQQRLEMKHKKSSGGQTADNQDLYALMEERASDPDSKAFIKKLRKEDAARGKKNQNACLIL